MMPLEQYQQNRYIKPNNIRKGNINEVVNYLNKIYELKILIFHYFYT